MVSEIRSELGEASWIALQLKKLTLSLSPVIMTLEGVQRERPTRRENVKIILIFIKMGCVYSETGESPPIQSNSQGKSDSVKEIQRKERREAAEKRREQNKISTSPSKTFQRANPWIYNNVRENRVERRRRGKEGTQRKSTPQASSLQQVRFHQDLHQTGRPFLSLLQTASEPISNEHLDSVAASCQTSTQSKEEAGRPGSPWTHSSWVRNSSIRFTSGKWIWRWNLQEIQTSLQVFRKMSSALDPGERPTL